MPKTNGWLLIEVLLCLGLLSFVGVVLVLPQLYALRVEAQVAQLHRIYRALDDLAAGLSVDAAASNFLTQWQRALLQSIPGLQLELMDRQEHSWRVQCRWPLVPGLVAFSSESQTSNVLVKTVYF